MRTFLLIFCFIICALVPAQLSHAQGSQGVVTVTFSILPVTQQPDESVLTVQNIADLAASTSAHLDFSDSPGAGRKMTFGVDRMTEASNDGLLEVVSDGTDPLLFVSTKDDDRTIRSRQLWTSPQEFSTPVVVTITD